MASAVLVHRPVHPHLMVAAVAEWNVEDESNALEQPRPSPRLRSWWEPRAR